MKKISKKQTLINANKLANEVYQNMLNAKTEWSDTELYAMAEKMFETSYESKNLKLKLRTRLYAMALLAVNDIGQNNLTLLTYLTVYDRLRFKTAKCFLKTLKSVSVPIDADAMDIILRRIFEVIPKIVIEEDGLACYI